MIGRRRRERERELRDLRARAEKLERALAKRVRPKAPTVPLLYEQADIVLAASSKRARKRRTGARKEPFTVEWIESLPDAAVLYDIGANVGVYSLIAAKRPAGPLRVVAFEPGFATFATLCTNVVLNQAEDHVMPLPVTLGARTALGRFRYSDLSAGAALHGGGIDELESGTASRYDQPVLVFALDDLIASFGLPAPTHVKLDVDGAELPVLQGARVTLGDQNVHAVLVELSVRDDEAVDALLAGAGFVRAQTWRRGREDGAGIQLTYARYERPHAQ